MREAAQRFYGSSDLRYFESILKDVLNEIFAAEPPEDLSGATGTAALAMAESIIRCADAGQMDPAVLKEHARQAALRRA